MKAKVKGCVTETLHKVSGVKMILCLLTRVKVGSTVMQDVAQRQARPGQARPG